ncbi:MAG TPA: M15 family metallopeptidase [Hanamia sp.]
MNRICRSRNLIQISVVIFIFHITLTKYVLGQSKIGNKYGLHVINDTKVLQNELDLDSNKKMEDLRKLIPGIQLDLRYASVHNFMHEKLYPSTNTTFLRKPAADSLKKVIEFLKSKNLTIKIFDAYRPYSVTEKMWEEVKDSRYAADPSKGSGHNRGTAVDLTLIDLKTNEELNMGTGFDNFTDSAHINFIDLPREVLKNRSILRSTMEKFGFIQLTTEWWHYYLPNSSSYEILDISFKDLKKMDKN